MVHRRGRGRNRALRSALTLRTGCTTARADAPATRRRRPGRRALLAGAGPEAGGVVPLTRRLRSHNACKTCAVGMGGMVNERGSFPEVCKKSVQAQAADMQPPIAEDFFRRARPRRARAPRRRASSKRAGRIGFPLALARRRPPLPSHRAGTRRSLSPPPRCAPRRPTRPSSTRRGAAATRRRSCCSASRASTAPTTSTTARTTATRRRAWRSPTRIGSGTATVTLDDLEQADLALVIGANPASNHPRLITQLVELRRRGGTVIVDQSAARARAGALPRAVGLAQHAVRLRRLGPLPPAARRRRHRAPDAAAQGRRRARRRRRGLRARAHDRLGRGASRDGGESRDDAAGGVRRAGGAGRRRGDSPLRGPARDLRLGDGDHAARARRRQRARARQPRAGARHGSVGPAPACSRSAVTPTCRASARSASRRR